MDDTVEYQYPASPQRNDPQYIAYLEQRIVALEARLPETKVIAQGFLARAFAIWGHYFVAQLLISLIIGAIMMLISLVFAGSMAAIFGPMTEGASYY